VPARASMQPCLSSTQRVCAILWRQLWSLWLHHICRHYLINGMIFEKELLNIKCVFWFSLRLLSKTFLILKRIQRDIVINVKTSPCKVPSFLFLILTIIQRDIVINVKTSPCKVPSFLFLILTIIQRDIVINIKTSTTTIKIINNKSEHVVGTWRKRQSCEGSGPPWPIDTKDC
jgi:predicted DNA-binding protein (MmcQ/YjbR family)